MSEESKTLKDATKEYFEEKLFGSEPIQPSQEEYSTFMILSNDLKKQLNKKTDAELLNIAGVLSENIYQTKKQIIFERLKETRDDKKT